MNVTEKLQNLKENIVKETQNTRYSDEINEILDVISHLEDALDYTPEAVLEETDEIYHGKIINIHIKCININHQNHDEKENPPASKM